MDIFGGWWMELLHMISLSLVIILVGAIFSLSLSFSFCHALEACGIPSLGMHLFISFCIAHTLW